MHLQNLWNIACKRSSCETLIALMSIIIKKLLKFNLVFPIFPVCYHLVFLGKETFQ